MPTATAKTTTKRDCSTIVSRKRLLDTRMVCEFLSISPDSLAELRADARERFPAPVDIVKKGNHWALDDIEHYVERKQRDAKQENRN